VKLPTLEAFSFSCQVHVTEYLWMNYPQPFELHDYRTATRAGTSGRGSGSSARRTAGSSGRRPCRWLSVMPCWMPSSRFRLGKYDVNHRARVDLGVVL